ncbi:MAG: DNA-3-methyladenine glycosylase [Peptococcaceae bacterium]|jgi:DNA-3-methyladenine glycosylase|nr:DNA-3-methyladenine glycosylase [Peptococcaceae bacterium]
MAKLPRGFYHRDTVEIAEDLIGRVLVHRTADGVTAGRIVEAEAYAGKNDAACHSAKGNSNGRTAVMYGSGGFAYVYLIYGMYYCMNIVTRAEGEPEAVLIRALEPLEGIRLMASRRGVEAPDNMDTPASKLLRNLCAGPGKLCIAMAIDKRCYGLDLCGSELFLDEGTKPAAGSIAATKRINVDYAGEAADYPWRFILKDSPYLSVKKPGPAKKNLSKTLEDRK